MENILFRIGKISLLVTGAFYIYILLGCFWGNSSIEPTLSYACFPPLAFYNSIILAVQDPAQYAYYINPIYVNIGYGWEFTIIFFEAYIISEEVGEKRKIGGNWTIFFCLTLTPLIGAIISLLSPLKEVQGRDWNIGRLPTFVGISAISVPLTFFAFKFMGLIYHIYCRLSNEERIADLLYPVDEGIRAFMASAFLFGITAFSFYIFQDRVKIPKSNDFEK